MYETLVILNLSVETQRCSVVIGVAGFRAYGT